MKNLGIEHLGGSEIAGLVQLDSPPEQLSKVKERLGRAHRDDNFGC